MLSESQPSRVQLQTFPAAQGTDAVTAQTVGIMCSYIKDACADPVIRLAAQHALKNYGQDANDPAMRAWAAFWFVKHQVKFVVDEAPMMRLGRSNEQDLLMSPSVLIRMDKPQEDCDGFTMLCAERGSRPTWNWPAMGSPIARAYSWPRRTAAMPARSSPSPHPRMIPRGGATFF